MSTALGLELPFSNECLQLGGSVGGYSSSLYRPERKSGLVTE